MKSTLKSSATSASLKTKVREALDLKKENEALNQRIKRLEEAGDAMERYCDAISAENWTKAKESQ